MIGKMKKELSHIMRQFFFAEENGRRACFFSRIVVFYQRKQYKKVLRGWVQFPTGSDTLSAKRLWSGGESTTHANG